MIIIPASSDGSAQRTLWARRKRIRTAIQVLLWSVLLVACLPAWGNPISTEHVTARLLAEHGPAVPGQPLDLLLSLAIRPHWHTYWRNPGDSGEAPRIDWALPAGVTAGPLQFPAPELIRVGPLVNFGYSDRALHPVSLHIPADWPVGEPVRVRAQAHWLVCEEYCVPESAVLDLTIETAVRAGPIDPRAREPFAHARAGLPQGSIAGVQLAESTAGLRLSLPRDTLDGTPRTLRFFPASWGLIEHAPDQPWRLNGDRLEIDLTPGDAAAMADPGGLLVVTGAAGQVRSFTLEVSREAPEPARAGTPLGLPLALGLAFLGGLILNLMPCVFPVLAIKALSLAGQAGLTPRERVLHGLAYTLGVLVFFAGLTALLLGLRAGGTAVGWGFQLQYPPFVAGMAYVFLVMGLALAGALTLGGALMGLGGGAAVGRMGGVAGAFATGALAALVAAPCTAPFMGAALGYALTLAWPRALAILLVLGLGLSAPFLALSLAPGLARRLPRPGVWMEHLKQFLAFPMFATAAWLVWVLSVQVGPAGVAAVLAGMLVLSLGLWARERTLMARAGWQRAGAGAALAGLALALWLGFSTTGGPGVRAGAAAPPQSGLRAEPWSAARLAEARAQGRPVFVNMTAAWCITCLVNERVALSSASVAAAFARANLLYLKGDWTHRDPAIGAYLAGFGRSGVPIYVVYPVGGEPRVLPQILTPATVVQALGTAPGDSGSSADR